MHFHNNASINHKNRGEYPLSHNLFSRFVKKISQVNVEFIAQNLQILKVSPTCTRRPYNINSCKLWLLANFVQVIIQCLRYLWNPCTNSLDWLHGNMIIQSLNWCSESSTQRCRPQQRRERLSSKAALLALPMRNRLNDRQFEKPLFLTAKPNRPSVQQAASCASWLDELLVRPCELFLVLLGRHYSYVYFKYRS